MDRLLAQLTGASPAAVRIGGPAARGVSAFLASAATLLCRLQRRTGRSTWRPVLLASAAALLCLAAGGCARDAGGDPPLALLRHTFPSPEALSRAVLTALAARDVDTLRALPLDETEFRNAVWPDLPASRPERNVPFDYAWGDLRQKSDNARRRLAARHGGRRYELVRVLFDAETTRYRTYEVHRETVLDLRDEEGEEVRLALFGSILEREGRFKLFSYVVD